MKKQYKIKRYRKINSGGIWRKLLKGILSLAVLSVLIFIGISIYNPVYNLIMGNYKPAPRPDISQEEEPEVEPAEEEPEPDPAPVRSIAAPRAVYLSAAVLGDEQQLDAFLASLNGAEVDSVMIDIKGQDGMVLFNTANEDAWAWGTAAEGQTNLGQLAQRLERQGLSLVVRMSAFLDPVAPYGNRDNAIHYQDTDMLWLDAAADGKAWLNPYAAGTRSYLTALAVEAVEHGASIVILENVHFPDGSDMAYAGFGSSANGVSRQQILTTFVSEITQAVEAAGGRLGVYLSASAVTQTNNNEVRYGGSPLEILDNTLVLGLLPYQFYSGFNASGLELENPYADPVATVKTAAEYVMNGLAGREIMVVPLLQGGNEPTVPGLQITSGLVAGQVAAAQEAGGEGYILYQTSGSYALS